MSILSRLFGKGPGSRKKARPAWRRTVELARQPRWYSQLGVEDSMAGRFDAVTLVLCLVLLRMEREEALVAPSVLLTEIFVEDMDGQLRQGGVGDLSVGKHIGKQMSVLGGRLGALRYALPRGEDAVADYVRRNVTLIGGAKPDGLAGEIVALHAVLEGTAGKAILAGEFG